MVGIVDYGTANVGALLNMHRRCGIAATRLTSPDGLCEVDRIILPGIGAFDNGMRQLRERGFESAIRAAVARRIPLLGICLGMQLLGKGSEEGQLDGLGLLEATCQRFRFASELRLKVPHQGWARPVVRRSSQLLPSVTSRTRFYFSHSYHLVCDDAADVVAVSNYGTAFTAVVQRDLVFGVQFHPEKSHVYGMQLLQAFSGVPT